MKQLLLLIFFVQLLTAAPAFQGKRTFTQPNGESITYRLKGDEYLHWMEDEEGTIMLLNKKNKRLESVLIENNRLKASGKMITKRHRSAAKDATPSITHKELFELQKKRRDERLSKMKKLPFSHYNQ